MYRFLIICLFAVIVISCNQQSPSHHFKNANAKYELKNYAGAVEDLNRAIELDGDFKEAYYLRALSFTKLDDPDNARKDFNKAIDLDPKFADAYLNRAFYVKMKSGEYESAIQDYNTYLTLDKEGNHAYALNNRGFAKYKMGDYKGAIDDIDASLKINPDNAYAYRNRALINIAFDSIEDACRDLQISDSLGFAKDFGNEVEELINQYCNQD